MKIWGGDSLKNGVQVCVALKTPFSHSPGCLQDPHFNIFHFLRPCPTFTPKSQISRDFKFQSLKISRGKLQSFKLSQNSVHMATLCWEFQLTRVPFRCLSVWSFELHITYTQMKVEGLHPLEIFCCIFIKGELHLKPKVGMFCMLSQNYQHF